jgi:putative ABC transport system permease protein
MPDALITDIRIAIRTLVKARGFTAAVVLTLGLAMALCAAVLLVVNAYLIRELPYPAASRLYAVPYAPPGEAAPQDMETLNWRALDDVIEHPIAWDLDMFYLIGGEHAESAPGAWVTPGFMQGLGIDAAIGRGFDADAFRTGSPQVALISHGLWQRRFGGDAAILGRRFEAYVSDRPEEAETFTIVGVLPPGFWHLNPYTDILTPLRAETYPYLVRLREGVPAADAAARITALVRARARGVRHDFQAQLVSIHDGYVAGVRPVLRAVTAAAGLVLLVAAANVAALLLIRATRRQREMAVRMALGAGRAGIARVLAVEGLLLAFGATAVGLAAGGLATAWLAPIIQRELGRPAPGLRAAAAASSTQPGAFGIDGSIILVAVGAALIMALACAIFPLAASWRSNLQSALHSATRSATEGRGSQRARSILIALEIAASLALVAGSTLMVRSVVRMIGMDFGIRAERVLSAPVALRQRNYPTPADRLGFYERLLPRLTGIPGVESASLGHWYPLQQPRGLEVQAEDSGQRARAAARRSAQVPVLAAGAGWFETLGVPIVAGRTFTTADRQGTEPVAIVSQSLARLLWPDDTALGSRVFVPDESDTAVAAPVGRIIVGVARDVRQTPADETLADLYVPLLQTPSRFARIYVRTAGAPASWLPAVRSAVREVDPEVTLDRAEPLQTTIDAQSARPKFLASLLTTFALVAALLALVGVYGVIAYAVRQREREIAVRMAVGAEPRRITRLFLRQGLIVLFTGLALGLLGSLGAGRMLESQLFGVAPSDPASLVLACTAFAAAGLLAVWWPARRAAATDPAGVLRDE